MKKIHSNLTLVWIKNDLEDKELEKMIIRQKIKEIQIQINSIKSELDTDQFDESIVESLLSLQIKLLHEYNDIKDIGQMLLGKYAELQGTTTAEMYHEFGLDLKD